MSPIRWYKSEQGKYAIWAPVWLALAIAYFSAVLLHQPQIYDEGLIVSGAERIARGQVPYRDFYTGYPPAQFYTIAAVFRVFGATLLAERIWDTLWRMAIAALACLLAARAAGRRPHPLPLICIGILTGATDFRLYPMISAALFAVAALCCAFDYLNGRGIRWLWLSGLVAGAGVLYRHDLLFCICVAVTMAVSYRAIVECRRHWLKVPGVFVAGVLLPVAPLVGMFLMAVPHEALWQAFFEFPRINAAARHLPLPAPSIPALADFYLPLAIVAVSSARWRRTAAAGRPALLLWLLSAGLTLLLAIQRLDTLHAYPAILFSVVLCSWLLANTMSSRWRLVLLCAIVLCYGIKPLFLWRLEVAEVLRAPRPGIARAGLVRLEPDQREAIRYIQQHLPAGQPLYVGLAAHSLAYFNDALFCFLADRPQVTRFDMFLPGVTTTAAGQSEIAANIQRKRVEYVVLFSPPLSPEPNASSLDSGITLLDDAIKRDYTETAHFGRYTISRRINPQMPGP